MKKLRQWRIIYGVCCLVYLGWMINLGTNEFDRINSQYRQVADQLDIGRIRTTALEELMAECRKTSTVQPDRNEDDCYSLPPTLVEAREIKIEERLFSARERASIKLVLFYLGFVVFFLLAPPFLIYLLVAGIIKVFSHIKFVK